MPGKPVSSGRGRKGGEKAMAGAGAWRLEGGGQGDIAASPHHGDNHRTPVTWRHLTIITPAESSGGAVRLRGGGGRWRRHRRVRR